MDRQLGEGMVDPLIGLAAGPDRTYVALVIPVPSGQAHAQGTWHSFLRLCKMSNPVNIRVPRPVAGGDGISGSFVGTTPLGTPDLRALRAIYAGTPPPNIPPRGLGTPARAPSPLPLPSLSATPNLRPPVIGGISARRPDSPAHGSDTPPVLDLDDMPEEDKAKVLRRHLVSKEERQKHADRVSNSDLPSRPPSSAKSRPQRADTELFPVPYDAPGADITCVHEHSL